MGTNPWYGPGVTQLLRNVKAKDAAAHPIEGAHSIWELVLHMVTWKAAPHRWINGSAKPVSKSENFPKVRDTSERAWKAAVAKLKKTQAEWDKMIAILEDETIFDSASPSGLFSQHDLLIGVLQHDTYHAGQIALLKKALGLKV
jgi:uncharacterized damage-inducible protein DinB